MNNIIKIIASLLAILCITSGTASANGASESINRFAFDLYGQIAKNNAGNVFFSPQSISSAIAMVYAGAAGQTAEEMRKTMSYDADVHAQMKSLLDTLNGTPEDAGTLEGANAIWPSAQYKLRAEYADLVRKFYDASVTELDYKNKTSEAIAAINSWADEKTHGKIPEIVTSESVTPLTTAVLTNAIYFRARWADPFPKKNTKKEDFFVTSGDVKKVDMMRKKECADYAETATVQALRLPYNERLYSMLIILPKDKNLEMSKEFFDEIVNKLSSEEVMISLPKFELRTYYENLQDYLKPLGMNLIFTDNSEVTKMMDGDDSFKIDKIIHKTFCAVDEDETEAAAVTAITMMRTTAMAPAPAKIFNADHPFAYFILDNRTDTILFMGRYVGE